MLIALDVRLIANSESPCGFGRALFVAKKYDLYLAIQQRPAL
jgi:hypothetical protein